MMINSSSFESPKSYLFGHCLKQQFSAFKVSNRVLKSANLPHKQGFDDSQLTTTVCSTKMISENFLLKRCLFEIFWVPL